MSDTSDTSVAANVPATIYGDRDALTTAKTGHQGALSAARASQADIAARRQAETANILKALDETTASLKQAHGTGLQRLAPTLLASAAAMLRTTPGVQSNFLGELGQGLAAAAPGIERMRMSDEEFWGKIAALQKGRGEIAML